MGKLEGKVSIITGGGSGIGRATALLFAREGAHVLVADWDEGSAKQTAQDIDRDGGSAIYTRTDVRQVDDVELMIQTAVQTWGGIDVVFNNAGTEGEQAPTADCSVENFDQVIAVDLRGVFLGMKFALPELVKRGGGSIINMSSVAGQVGFPNIPAYCAAKGGVIQLTKATALEYAARGVRVNAICPGVVWTPMVMRFTGGTESGRQQMTAIEPVRRLGRPEEVAELALFLAGDDATFCTGAAFTIDGGLTAA